MFHKDLLITLMLTVVTHSSAALQSDARQPVEIEADKMYLDEKSGVTLYEGKVRLSQGSISISAEKIQLHGNNGKLQRMQIDGDKNNPAVFQQTTENGQLVRGQAQKIDFNVKDSRLIFNGQAELTQGTNFIRSERIDYNTLSNSLIAGKKDDNSAKSTDQDRVHIVITPEQ